MKCFTVLCAATVSVALALLAPTAYASLITAADIVAIPDDTPVGSGSSRIDEIVHARQADGSDLAGRGGQLARVVAERDVDVQRGVGDGDVDGRQPPQGRGAWHRQSDLLVGFPPSGPIE